MSETNLGLHPFTFDDLAPFCSTDRQEEVLKAVRDHGSMRKAAIHLERNSSTINRSIAALKAKATQAGVGPHFVPGGPPITDPLRVKATSTFIKGLDQNQWVKTDTDLDRLATLREEAAKAFFAEFPKIEIPELETGRRDKTLIPWFNIGDAHLGMIAYFRECGHTFDLEIGARELLAAFKMLVDKAPKTDRCVINDLGDFTHYENFKGETEASGHRLDNDGRFPKMVKIVSVVWREMVSYALKKYRYVDVMINQGNHSRTNDIHFAELIEVAYGHTKRVNVVPNHGVFLPYKMGDTFVVTHHSDKASGKQLAEAILTTYAETVKLCKFIYCDTGHIHHRYVAKEYALIQMESWNNLAPNDAHHHQAGWRSKQSMSCVVRSTKYGELERFRVPVELVWESLQKALGDEVITSRPGPEVFVAV